MVGRRSSILKWLVPRQIGKEVHLPPPSGAWCKGVEDGSSTNFGGHLHEVSLEEGLQLLLGSSIRKISDVESAALCSAG